MSSALTNTVPQPAVAPDAVAAAEVTQRWFTFGEERFFLLLAIFIGIFAGLAVVCFRVTIEWARIELLGSAMNPSRTRALFAPAFFGLIVAALVIWIFTLVRGSCVQQTKAALIIYN